MNNPEIGKALEQISQKLSALLALSLMPDVREGNTSAKVGLLARCGISNQEIAQILGTTKGTVEVLKSRVPKRKK